MEHLNKISLEAFLEGQQAIYDKFRSNVHVVWREGISLSNIVQGGNRGGYAVNLRHPKHITDNVREFSLAVARTAPAIVFDETNAHTSLIVYGVGSDFTPYEEVIQALEKGVHAVWNQLRRPKINYLGWLCNQDSVIAEGYANGNFVSAMNVLMETLSQRGIPDIGERRVWGGHITTNRFIEQRSPEALTNFFKLMDNPHSSRLGYSEPTFLDVGYFRIMDDAGSLDNPAEGFKYIVTKRFEF